LPNEQAGRLLPGVCKQARSTHHEVRTLHMPQEDITNVDLDGVLPSATIMVVSVTASTTAGQPLPDAEIAEVCAMVVNTVMNGCTWPVSCCSHM
jgi:hypothetical protein